MQVNQYFLGTAVAQWNLADFILSTGLMEATFLADLQKIRRAKRLPSPVRLFAYAMIKYYNGEVGRHNIEIAQLEALKRLNRTKLTLKSYLLAQKDAEHEMGQDIAVQSVNVLAAEGRIPK
ncbi:hypothetical protein BG005_008425 [Podila minutissima]|nr:hypothetical protein BG005_008425 [Podila minutissima]